MTCAQPVMPGLIARRPRWRGVYWSTCAGSVGPRADQRHLAAQHVQQVGKLIQRGPAQERADARDARVVRVDRQPRADVLGAVDHRAQLEHVERLPVAGRRAAGGRSPGPRDSRRIASIASAQHRRAQHQQQRGDQRCRGRGARSSASPRPHPTRRRCRGAASPTARRRRGRGEHVVARDQQRAHAQRAGERGGQQQRDLQGEA